MRAGWLPLAETKASEADWQQTADAAKTEDKVGGFLYQRVNIETAVNAFEQKFPDVHVITASPSAVEMVNKLLKEIIKE